MTLKKTTTKTPVKERDVPFFDKGDLSDLINEYRTHCRTNPIPQNGQGQMYKYVVLADFQNHIDSFLANSKAYRTSDMKVSEAGENVVYAGIKLGTEKKSVYANIGTPKNIQDLGARITYAQKYLLSVLFGVSIQTNADDDGETKGVAPIVTPVVTTVKPEAVASVAPILVVTAPTDSPLFTSAQNAIRACISIAELDAMKGKVENAKKLNTEEQKTLLAFVEERRGVIGEQVK